MDLYFAFVGSFHFKALPPIIVAINIFKFMKTNVEDVNNVEKNSISYLDVVFVLWCVQLVIIHKHI
jgi:hypothetical protein